MAKYSNEIITAAKLLYLKRATPKEIANNLNLPNARIVYYWAVKNNWPDMLSHESTEEAIERRIQILSHRDNKSLNEVEELRMLISSQLDRIKEANRHKEKLAVISTKENDEIHNTGEPGKKKRRYKKNDISGLKKEDFDAFAENNLFKYQQHLRLNITQQIRNILKSRQIGATWYFAFEAFENAVLTGDPQIFLSASKAQAEVFKSYIVGIASKFFGIELTGNPIRLSNGAELRFLSTNKNTAQSYSGHLYCDEYFWIPNFTTLNEVASGMATHDKWRITYFSTPSAKTHPAYTFWTGEEWKKGSPKRKNIKFPIDKELRDGGRLCPDDQWRYIITMEDAIAGGFNLASIKKLRNRYNESAFNMLFMCVFVDSKDSIFRWEDLDKCGVEPESWQDFNEKTPRPFGNREVWGGYDPARSGDTSTFVIIAPPIHEKERFRVLKVYQWQGMNFKYQASQIKKIFTNYNMTYLGIDVTGIGQGVYDVIEHFAPREVAPIRYDMNTKNRLVMKMIDVIADARIEWDIEKKDIAASFLAIRRTTTGSGQAMTFVADRSNETGHADAFFAISHALINEPIDFESKRGSRWGNMRTKK